MKSNRNSGLSKLSKRQLLALPHILASPSYEEAARRAEISPKQIYEWMKDPIFSKELKNQRNTVFCNALALLKTGVQKASETLIRLLDNEDPRICLQAADKILSHTFKGMELIEIEERISTLEKVQQKQDKSPQMRP